MFEHFFKSSKQEIPSQNPIKPIHIVIMGRDDNATVNLSDTIATSFSQAVIFSVTTENDFMPEDFLNDTNKNFFDFFDSGVKVIKKHNADILMRFYQEGSYIRFHFLTRDMYLTENPPYFSALSALYLPISYFQTHTLPAQICRLIEATCIALSLKKDIRYEKILYNFVNVLSKNKMPEGIEKRFMPHILSFLMFNYLALHSTIFSKKDMKLMLSLVRSAHQSKSGIYDGILEGTLLLLQGQIYLCASDSKNADSYIFLERAIESIKKALKYFNKYVFPYDYGHLSFILAKLYFSYFNLQENRQAMRDAIFYMREAQKVFTFTSFPYFWADIEGYLGSYLMRLSLYSETKDIIEVAIQNYKNRQKVYQKETFPLLWAETQKSIADAYYYSAKNLNNEAYLQKASDFYFDALEIFELHNDTRNIQAIENMLQKINEKFLS